MDMPSHEQRHPAWAQRDRASDLMWIQDNLHVLWPAASQAYVQQGRGAVIVDTRIVGQHESGMGNPMYYLAQAEVSKMNNPNASRMVREYDPDWEFVAGLLKPRRRESFYRVGIPSLRPRP